MAPIVNMQDAKSSLSRLVKRAASSEEILIAAEGMTLATSGGQIRKYRVRLVKMVEAGGVELKAGIENREAIEFSDPPCLPLLTFQSAFDQF